MSSTSSISSFASKATVETWGKGKKLSKVSNYLSFGVEVEDLLEE